MTADDMKCCYIPDEEQDQRDAIGCPNPAKYEIQDLEDSDPYVCLTHSCTEHVGEMLGHAGRGNWSEGDSERWEVYPLA